MGKQASQMQFKINQKFTIMTTISLVLYFDREIHNQNHICFYGYNHVFSQPAHKITLSYAAKCWNLSHILLSQNPNYKLKEKEI